MFGLGATELIIILVVVLIIFGAGKLPKVMDELGKGVSAFRKGVSGKDDDAPKDVSQDDASRDDDKKAS